jgi:hypothetical protein
MFPHVSSCFLKQHLNPKPLAVLTQLRRKALRRLLPACGPDIAVEQEKAARCMRCMGCMRCSSLRVGKMVVGGGGVFIDKEGEERSRGTTFFGFLISQKRSQQT